MAEAVGLAATCAGLLGALSGLIKFSKKIHNAPKEWRRYCDSLENFCQVPSPKLLTAGSKAPDMPL